MLGIDDHEIRLGVLILHCPQQVSVGICPESIIVAKDGVGGDDIAIWVVLNDCAAFAVGAIRRDAIAITDKHMSIQYGNRIGSEVDIGNAASEDRNRVGS